MRVRILHHDHCFDGAASAAFFSRFLEAKFHPGASFDYTGLAHKASQLFEPEIFDGDVNAIVDFKYSTDPKLTWWFDHHQSAFLTPEDAEHFHRDTSGKKMYDPSFRSCTKYIATVAREKFGFEADDLNELVHWADIIDGAQYANSEEAVGLREPAMQLTLVIEGCKGSDTVHKIIRMMRHKSLAEIAADSEIQAIYAPMYQHHLRSIEIIGKRAEQRGKVVFFDLIDDGMEGYNKFIPYNLFPDSTYTVSVSAASFRTKVSVGSNPWVKEPLKHNLATICERYGGGGHAKVGAISFPIGAIAEARKAAEEIVEELNSEESGVRSQESEA
ncbi:MAG: phosphoesterase [Acidobacteriota bacterium]